MNDRIQARRPFFKKIILSFTALLVGSKLVAGKEEKAMQSNFFHIVFFWMKEPDNKESNAFFLSKLKEFLEAVPVVQGYYIGHPAGTQRTVVDNSYTYSIIVYFHCQADQDLYQQHSAHLAFVDTCKNLWERVQVYDMIRQS